ncbi:hypothetical protein CKALI_06760 [Corynebacterium kalinowskii]|uniref:Uncharacterized protein n=1 Tax=Corynebacterium kalinowskii TaxID=2675216 RepID=A0A6B8VL91_9CORY|nr:hypothetical protein [Corynebacterium kalinowskii]QGU02214.1 hypothetical protein CKALI_06760 [Corynebacterium kalinowskii]
MTRELQSIGMSFERWQDAVEAAIASEKLEVIGEVRGGQLIEYTDPSGAQMFILAAEPFTTFSGFDASTVHDAHVSMVNDVLALCDLVNDEGYHVATVAAHLAQGPLLVDEPTQQWQHLKLSALAVDTSVYSDSAAAQEAGVEPGSLVSHGADIVNSGAASAPDASATLTVELTGATVRTNELTGTKFVHALATSPIALDICLPYTGTIPADGNVVSGTFLLTSEIKPPAGCGGDGGCGSGGCGGGCGGH